MNWYKVIISEIRYTDIGHHPEGILWYWDGNNLHTVQQNKIKPVKTKSTEGFELTPEEIEERQEHGNWMASKFKNIRPNFLAGRYDPKTNYLSISDNYKEKDIPSDLEDALLTHFPNHKKMFYKGI